MKNLGIYIHIPFCESKCDYCNFVSFKLDDEVKEKYVDYLLKEISLAKKQYADYVVDTIFVGGGTPSCLREKSIKTILNHIENNFNVSVDAEITVEANPNSLSLSKLREFKLAGVNRLSIGLQAYNNRLLKSIGRIHTTKQFDEAVKNAKSVGFENISADVLLGLPNQKMFDVVHELKHLVKLGLKHISAYGLIVEENTKIFKRLQSGEIKLPTEQKSLKFYEKTLRFLKKHGFFRYEVSNFCKIGYESKHNLKYWNMDEYVGFGLASHSFVDNTRWENTSKLQEYFDMLEQNLLPQKNKEKQSVEDLKMEFVMTGLRQTKGISLEKYNLMFGEDLQKSKSSELDDLLKQNLVVLDSGNLKATDKGFEVLNYVILQLV